MLTTMTLREAVEQSLTRGEPELKATLSSSEFMKEVRDNGERTQFNLRMATVDNQLNNFEWRWLASLATLKPRLRTFGEWLVEEEVILMSYNPEDNPEGVDRVLKENESLLKILDRYGLKVKDRSSDPTDTHGWSADWQVFFVPS